MPAVGLAAEAAAMLDTALCARLAPVFEAFFAFAFPVGAGSNLIVAVGAAAGLDFAWRASSVGPRLKLSVGELNEVPAEVVAPEVAAARVDAFANLRCGEYSRTCEFTPTSPDAIS